MSWRQRAAASPSSFDVIHTRDETVNGKTYPETVLFRMATAQRAPLVKLTVSENGSALGLSDDSTPGGVELRANKDKGNYVRIVNREGREQTLKP